MDKQAFDLLMKRFDQIEEGQERLRSEVAGSLNGHADRIDDLEKREARRTGIMIGGGAVVTFFSGLISWVAKHI